MSAPARVLRRSLGLVIGAVLASVCADARAQQADAGAVSATPPAPAQPARPAVTLPSSETQHWPELYAEARQALLDGEWEKAAAELERLVEAAPTPEDARAAKELAALARYWQKRDLAFVQRQALGESSLSSKAVDRRTVDEIVTLYATAAAYGSGLGLSMAALLDGSSTAAYVVPAIVGAGAGIGGVALADTFGRFRYGQPQAVASGTLLGLGEALIFDSWHGAHDANANVPSAQQWGVKAYVGVGIATTTLGGAIGGVLGTFLPMTPGRASWVSSMGIWSGTLVACISGAFAAGTLKEDVALFGLAGYNAGILAGIFTAGPVSPSISRVRLLDLGGIVGGLSAMGLYFAAVNGGGADGNAALGVTGLGVAAGLTTTWLLTMRMTPDRPNEESSANKPSASVHPMIYPVPGGASGGFAGTF